MHRVVRWVSIIVIVVGGFALAFGALLLRAAHVTNAVSDYTIRVSWASALASTLWPLSHLPWLLLLAVVAVIGITAFVFFRTRRRFGIPLLLVESSLFYWFWGWLGLHFLIGELTREHFAMDGEKLGEYWFSFESLAVWSAALALLAILRFIYGKHISGNAKA